MAGDQLIRDLLVDRIERLVQVDVGRNIAALFEAARGGLVGRGRGAVRGAGAQGRIDHRLLRSARLAACGGDRRAGRARRCSPRGSTEIGIPCRLATDEPCRSACAAALAGAGVSDVPVDCGADSLSLIETWRRCRDHPRDLDRALRAQRRRRAAQYERPRYRLRTRRRSMSCSPPGRGRRSRSGTAATRSEWARSPAI